MILTILENERLGLQHCGSAEDREQFLIDNSMDIHINKDGVKFYNPGVYQIGVKCPLVLVLPHFFKNGKYFEQEGSQSKEINQWFELISSFASNLNQTMAIEDLNNDECNWEPIFYSVLLLTDTLITKMKSQVFFHKNYMGLTTVRGKWDVQRDIKQTNRPTKFHCTVTSIDSNNIILSTIKSTMLQIHRFILTRSNQLLVDDIIRKLGDVESINLSESTFQMSKVFLIQNKLDCDWSFILEFYQRLITKAEDFAATRGISFKLPMDIFFEDLLSKIFERLGLRFHQQFSMDLLGGSRWEKEGQVIGALEYQSKSRPDFVVETETAEKVIEAKYKNLVLPPNRNIEGVSGKPLSRNDRNQVLSFALSYLSTPLSKKIEFYVIYPFLEIDCVDVASLNFPLAEIGSSNTDNFISVKRNQKHALESLKIHFIGLNVNSAIAWLRSDTFKSFERQLKDALNIR